MIVRTVSELAGTRREVEGPGWRSTRVIVRDDGVGYSLHETVVAAGMELRLEYKHHFETNYCVAGSGEVVDLVTGQAHPLRPGTVYALDKHDAHVVRAFDDGLRLVCVFSPALRGDETHDSSGGYEVR